MIDGICFQNALLLKTYKMKLDNKNNLFKI